MKSHFGNTKKPMRISIDISQSVYPRGVGRYTRELVSALLKINSANEYILFGTSLRQQKALKEFINSLKPNAKNLTTKLYPIPPTILEILFNMMHLSIDGFIGKIDVFHSSDWTQPATRAKKVTTIHDMIAVKFPELFDSKTIAVQKRRLKWVKKEVDRIIVVSENTKKDVIETLQIPDDKLDVIYEAASPIFHKRGEKEIETVKKKFGIEGEYLLMIITRSVQKVGKLFEAFKMIKKNYDVKLVIVGETLNDGEGIIQTGFVDDETLATLYSGAAVFVFPSSYEGFGLPVIEAMACEVPVVCSKTSSLSEIAGDAAIFVEPDSADDIALGVQKILSNKKFAQELSIKAKKQADKFSWVKTAEFTLKVYGKVLQV